MASEQTDTRAARGREGKVAEHATDSKEKREEEEEEEDDDDADNDEDKPLDPAKHIEAHILPRLDADVVDYVLNEVVRKAPKKPVPLAVMRANPHKYRSLIAVETGDGSFPRVATYTLTSETDGGTFPVRVYHPDAAEHGGGPYPVHLNYHGGGFVFGDLQSEAQLCLSMREAGVVVVDVNYRHCPETTWGRCFEDGWAAVTWVRNSAAELNVDAASVSLGGISAGGHIALVMQQRARDAGVPLRLVMPTVPAAGGSLFYQYYTDSPHRSFHEFVRVPLLPWARVQFFAEQCLASVTDAEAGLGPGHREDTAAVRSKRLAFLRERWPRAWLAPLDAPAAHFAGLADTFVRTGELDSLRDEGEAYALALVAGGGRVTLRRYAGALHPFAYLAFSRQKRAFDVDSVVALRQAHGFAALAEAEVEARVDRVAAAVTAKRAQEAAEEDRKGREGREGKEKAE